MQELESKELKYSTTWYDFGRMANVDGASQGPQLGTNIYHQVEGRTPLTDTKLEKGTGGSLFAT